MELLNLSETPQKDGIATEYKCGFKVTGSWTSRIRQHEEFAASPLGKYIRSLEKNVSILDLKKAAKMLVDDGSNTEYTRAICELIGEFDGAEDTPLDETTEEIRQELLGTNLSIKTHEH